MLPEGDIDSLEHSILFHDQHSLVLYFSFGENFVWLNTSNVRLVEVAGEIFSSVYSRDNCQFREKRLYSS